MLRPERAARCGQPGSAIGQGLTGTPCGRAPLSGTRRSARTCRARRHGSRSQPHCAPTRNRAPRPPTSHSRSPGAERKSPTHRSGSASSDRPGCWRRSAGPGAQATDKDLRLEFDRRPHRQDDDDDDDDSPGRSKILKLFESARSSTRRHCRTFSASCSAARGPRESSAAGGELQVGSVRRTRRGRTERPATSHPDPIHRRRQARRGTRRRRRAASGVGRPQRPVSARLVPGHRLSADGRRRCFAAGVPHDDVLRRRLSRVGLGPKVLRGRPDGDELDIEALIDLFVDLRSGYSPPEHVYPERRKLARNLGVLILLDASGSATDTDPEALPYTTTSDGRPPPWPPRSKSSATASPSTHSGHTAGTLSICPRSRRSTNVSAPSGRARLNQTPAIGLHPSRRRYPRRRRDPQERGGTPNRLLVVLSDGFPYDDGYEGRYAEADASRPSKSSAPKVLPAFAFPSAPPPPPMRSNASSGPPAMPAPRRWPT